MKRITAGVVVSLAVSGNAWAAGYSIGSVGKVLVGRQTNQVFVELLDATMYGTWPCSSTDPNGYKYAFLIDSEGGRAMLATVLAAKAAGQQLQIVDTGTCTIDTGMANATYVVAL